MPAQCPAPNSGDAATGAFETEKPTRNSADRIAGKIASRSQQRRFEPEAIAIGQPFQNRGDSAQDMEQQKRHAQLIEDAINAARAAAQDGVVAGGGTALLQIAPELDDLIASLSGSERIGATMLRSALEHPLSAIAANTGRNSDAVVERVKSADKGVGFDARSGKFGDMVAAGIIDPVAVSITALRNAASVAALILTTQTLIAKKPDYAIPRLAPR